LQPKSELALLLELKVNQVQSDAAPETENNN
jgi:hypothetical protein